MINVKDKSNIHQYASVNWLKEIYKSSTVHTSNAFHYLGTNINGLKERHKQCKLMPTISLYKSTSTTLSIHGIPITHDKKVLASDFQYSGNILKTLSSSEISDGKKFTVERGVSLIRPGDHIYGHWLIDILPQVWMLEKHLANKSHSYIIRKGLPPFVYSLMSLMGIHQNRLIEVNPTTQLCAIEECYLVDNLRFDQNIHPAFAEYSDSLEKMVSRNLKGKNNHKYIFISRGKWKNKNPNTHRILLNAKEVEGFYRERGFSIINPQELPIEEQISLFAEAKYIAGEDGSGLHNSMFSKNATINCLKGEKNHSLIQASIDSHRGNKIGYVLGKSNGLVATRNSSFIIDLNDLKTLYERSMSL